MDTGYTRKLSQRVYLDDGNPDGTVFSKNPRSDSQQGPVARTGGGQVVTYQQTLSPALIATITAAEQALTVGTTAANGPATTDFLAAINKPTAQAGLGFHGGRISAANTLQFSLSNPTAASVTPTASQVYNVTVLRGVVTNTQSVTPSVVPSKGTVETIVNIVNTQPIITVGVDGQGRLINPVIVSGGSGFYQLPNLIVTDVHGGFGAVLRPQVNASGVISDLVIEDPGYGYVSPIVSALGGNVIEMGMVAMVTKPTQTTGIAISNVRVSANNQIAIQMINPTAAAITPTAENYTFCCLNDIPAISNITSYGVVGTGLASCASQTSAEQSLTVSGLLATDIIVGVQKPTLSVGLGIANHRVSAANTMQLGFINATAAAVTPSATEVYGVTVYTQMPVMPFKKFSPVISPASVAANTTAEQTFTVTGLPFINSSPATVVVNKPSHQYGLGIAGARISAADTLAITFENTTSAAITPTASEKYMVGCFMAVGAGGGVPGSWVALPFSQSMQRTVESQNSTNDALVQYGIIKGS